MDAEHRNRFEEQGVERTRLELMSGILPRDWAIAASEWLGEIDAAERLKQDNHQRWMDLWVKITAGAAIATLLATLWLIFRPSG